MMQNHAEANVTNHADVPMIGIFWVVADEIHTVKLPPSEAPLSEGIRDIEVNHYSHWQEIGRQRTDRRLSDAYDYYPRGRIVYREAEGKFILYADRCILSDQTQLDRLIRKFHLSWNMVEFFGDLHYQCHRCNKEFLSFEPEDD